MIPNRVRLEALVLLIVFDSSAPAALAEEVRPPGAGQAGQGPDEAVYERAYQLQERAAELRSAGDPGAEAVEAEARQTWRSLIRSYPTSRRVPFAYVAIASELFDQGDLEGAERLYQQALRYPDSEVYGYALYRSAWVSLNLQDDREALSRFEQVVQYGSRQPTPPQGEQLGRAALRDLVVPYSRIGRPEAASAFFGRLAPGREPELLERLAERYDDDGRFGEARTVWRELLALAPRTDRRCQWQLSLARGVRASRPADELLVELRRAVEVMEGMGEGLVRGSPATVCRADTARLVVEVAAAWRGEATATRDPAARARARDLCDLALRAWPDLDRLGLDPIAGAPPSPALVRRWRADVAP